MILNPDTEDALATTSGRFAEETHTVPPALTHAESLVPHLKKCGYSERAECRPFIVDQASIPVAAFAGRPFDSWSACIAAVNLNGDSTASATTYACSALRPSSSAARRAWTGGRWDRTGRRPTGQSHGRMSAASFANIKMTFAVAHLQCKTPAARWHGEANSGSSTWGSCPRSRRIAGETLLRLVDDAIDELHQQFGAKLIARQGAGRRVPNGFLAARGQGVARQEGRKLHSHRPDERR